VHRPGADAVRRTPARDPGVMTTADSAPPPDARNQRLGAHGEDLAADYLRGRGCVLLARNWRDGRRGELDLIVRDGACVVAVEVKTRTGTGYGHPLEAITARKAGRLRRLLLAWVRQQAVRPSHVRVDAIGITLRPSERPRIDHLRGIG